MTANSSLTADTYISKRVWMSRGSLGRSVLGGGQDRDEPLEWRASAYSVTPCR